MIPLGVLASARHASGGGSVVFSDDFNRANGALGPDWTRYSTTGSMAVASNAATGDASTTSGAYANAAAPTDHYAQVTITTLGSSTSTGVYVRSPGGGTETGYLWRYNGSGQTQLIRATANTFTALGSAYSANLTEPITLRIEAQGSTIRGYVDGVLRQTVTDSTHTTGTHGGIRLVGNTVRVDDFEIGAL